MAETKPFLRKAEKFKASKFLCNLYGETDCDSLNALICEKTSTKVAAAYKRPQLKILIQQNLVTKRPGMEQVLGQR